MREGERPGGAGQDSERPRGPTGCEEFSRASRRGFDAGRPQPGRGHLIAFGTGQPRQQAGDALRFNGTRTLSRRQQCVPAPLDDSESRDEGLHRILGPLVRSGAIP